MFKKLKSLFIVEEEGASGGEGSGANPEEKSEPRSEPAYERPAFDKEKAGDGKLDEKFVNRLLGAIEDNNIDGFDYLEYKQALQNLNNVEMDEQTKFQSALAVAKTMGTSKDELLSSGQHYLKVLEKEEAKFIEAFQNQLARQVTTRSEQIMKKENGIEEKKAMIEKLQKEIEAQRKELEKMKSSVDSAKTKVEATRTRFYQAFHIVSEQIKDDLEKIGKYLS